MQYIKLGTTGLDVSPVAIGAMTYGDPGRGHPVWSLGEDESRPLIKHAIDSGINFFDTANMYSQGSSEEILGRACATSPSATMSSSRPNCVIRCARDPMEKA
jgi:1-deoxyxylulose-5-phosphate synthase